jgi:hypothetical protein
MSGKWAERAASWTPAGVAFAMLAGFHTLVLERLANDPFAVGHFTIEVSPALGRFLGHYLLFGLAAAGALTLAFHRGFLARLLAAQAAQLQKGGDRRFVLIACLAAFALAAACHRLLLAGMPLTDDEGVYRFAAQILAQGRLYLPTDPDADFLSHGFVIDDGRTFTQYFLGWPALMLPALRLGLEGYANAFYFALAMPAVFLALRRLAGSFWARLGLLLALASPMLLISAGTLLSHTSCFAALAWCLYFSLRSSENGSHWAWHSAFALAFSAAFFIRPMTAAALGLPLLVCWARQWPFRPDKGRILLAMALPAGAAAALFLAVNTLQNGGPFITAYDSYSSFMARGRAAGPSNQELGLVSASHSFAVLAAAFYRLGFAALGWPCSWLFVFFAGTAPGRGRILAMIPCYFACNLPVRHVGIDTYAPMHYIELGLPMVILTVLGIERLTAAARDYDRPGAARLSRLPLFAAGASLLVYLAAFMPYQLAAVHLSARQEQELREAAGKLPRPAVLFAQAPDPGAGCFGGTPASWVKQWPLNAPGLEADLVWLKHLGVERDRELMARRFPGRRGYVYTWNARCQLYFVPLEAAGEAEFPPIRERRGRP